MVKKNRRLKFMLLGLWCLMFLVFIPYLSAGYSQWLHVFAGGGDQIIESGREVADDGFILVGSTVVTSADGKRDALCLRLDAQGNTIWQKSYSEAHSSECAPFVLTSKLPARQWSSTSVETKALRDKHTIKSKVGILKPRTSAVENYSACGSAEYEASVTSNHGVTLVSIMR